MKNSTTKIVLLAIILFPTWISARNYYAAPDGTIGAAGNVDTPLDITSAMAKIDLDTLFLRGGTYNLTVTHRFSKTGIATSRKGLFAYQNEKPTLDFRGEAYGQRGVQFSGAYLHVKGITICYSGKNGFYNESSNSIFENCVTYGNGDTGFQNKSCSGNLILNCDSYENFDYQNGGANAADFGGNADGFADKQYTNSGAPNVYQGCRAWSNSDDGWDFFQKIGNSELNNSICYINGPAVYDMREHARYNTDRTWFDQFPRNVVDAKGNTVYVTLQNYKNFGNGNGFKLGGDYTAHNVKVTNCLSAQNTVKGFDQNNNNGNMTLYNNTGYNNAPDYGFGNRSYGALTIKNCVSLASKSGNTLNTKSVTNVNNSWNTANVTCNAADFVSTDATQILLPRKADGSLDNITFMHLVEGSDLIDKGVNVSLPYSGNAPDLGCYEFGNSSNYPPIIISPANRNQSITENTAIENIVYKWAGTATGLVVTNLPDNLIYTVNDSEKTLTISGIVATKGAYTYTVTTIGGTLSAAEESGIIIASSADAKKIAYVTIPESEADAPILDKLNANLDFKITTIDATETGVDYSEYDLVVLSSVPGSGSAGLVSIEALDKPRLLLKPFQLQASRWNWGTSVNTTASTMVIANKSHEIFSNLTFTGTNNDELVLFSSVSTNAVTGITSWIGNPAVDRIGTAKNITPTVQSLVEIPIGTTMNGTIVNSRFLMIGLSEYSTANLTTTATQLIENSCYYLMEMDIPTTSYKSSEKINYTLSRQGNTLSVVGVEVSSIKLYSTSGMLIKTAHNTNSLDINGLPFGVYLIQILTKENQNQVLKIMIR